jgi:hypothetical protein
MTTDATTDNLAAAASAAPTTDTTTPAVAATPAAPAPTILAGDPPLATATTISDAPEPAAPAAQPEQTWRDRMAGADPKFRKQLDRFQSEADFAKSYQALQQKLSSGDFKQTLPDNATPEQLTAYRKDNGIPETADKYDLTLPDGLVIGEADKPIVDGFLKAMHEQNASPAVVKSALATYYKSLEATKAAEYQRDTETLVKTTDDLRAEWGQDYKKNVNIFENYLSTLPKDFADNLRGARLADGRKLCASVEGVKYLVDLGMEKNPAAALLPNSSTPGPDIIAEMTQMEKRFGTKEWAKDTEANRRYLELETIRERLGLK